MAQSTRRHFLPELLFLALLGLGGWSLYGPQAPSPPASVVELPIPAARLLAGTAALSPGQWVTLKAFSPEDKDFVPQCYVGVELREVELQGAGMVLAAIPAAQVGALEAALADEKVRLTYHLVQPLPNGSLPPSANTCLSPPPAKPDGGTVDGGTQ
ncbi:MAG TPA: hypothetical protein VE153_14230 [Myxococcus sp.]|nr:hypothetical protein [Myxococcus sp.]